MTKGELQLQRIWPALNQSCVSCCGAGLGAEASIDPRNEWRPTDASVQGHELDCPRTHYEKQQRTCFSFSQAAHSTMTTQYWMAEFDKRDRFMIKLEYVSRVITMFTTVHLPNLLRRCPCKSDDGLSLPAGDPDWVCEVSHERL